MRSSVAMLGLALPCSMFSSIRLLTPGRLVGGYCQLHAAVADAFSVGRKGRFVPDSPLGRDVSGILASSGAFPTAEATPPPGSSSRTIRLVAANQDLKLPYEPYGRGVPALAIELAGFAVPPAAEAEEALLEYGTAYLFELGKATGASLRIWRPGYRLGIRRYRAYSGVVPFPRQRYDPHPAELYMAGNSPERDPVERYLKYYQVLEFYMPRVRLELDAAIMVFP